MRGDRQPVVAEAPGTGDGMKYVDTDPEPRVCRLCGATGLLELRPIELPDGKGGWTYESGLRCIDVARGRRQV